MRRGRHIFRREDDSSSFGSANENCHYRANLLLGNCRQSSLSKVWIFWSNHKNSFDDFRLLPNFVKVFSRNLVSKSQSYVKGDLTDPLTSVLFVDTSLNIKAQGLTTKALIYIFCFTNRIHNILHLDKHWITWPAFALHVTSHSTCIQSNRTFVVCI